MSLLLDWDSLPPEAHEIAGQIERWLPKLHESHSPEALIDQLERWQAQLETLEEPAVHLLWCFGPEFSLRLGPVSPLRPHTPWLRDRLSGVQIFCLESEPLQWGSLHSDTLLTARQDGWRIYLRDQIYIEQLQQQEREQGAPLGLRKLLESEEIIPWRQELNLAHEWGHLYTESHLAYQEPLLDRLSPHPPEEGLPIFQWFEALLEGLAECSPEHGALSFLAALNEDPQTEDLAFGLLEERLDEYSRGPGSLPLQWMRRFMLCALSKPPSTTSNSCEEVRHWFAQQLDGDLLNTMRSDLQGDHFCARVDQIGHFLQEILFESIEKVPPPGQADLFLPEIQLFFEAKTRDYLSDFHEDNRST